MPPPFSPALSAVRWALSLSCDGKPSHGSPGEGFVLDEGTELCPMSRGLPPTTRGTSAHRAPFICRGGGQLPAPRSAPAQLGVARWPAGP